MAELDNHFQQQDRQEKDASNNQECKSSEEKPLRVESSHCVKWATSYNTYKTSTELSI